MAVLRVQASDDPAEARQSAGNYLLSDPVRHSIFLSIVKAGPPGGRYWWAAEGDVVGFAMRAPRGFSAGVTPTRPEVVDALCDRIMADVPDLPGVIAEASVAARFAGRWAECLAVPARPLEAQRVYRLDEVVPPSPAGGRLRLATVDDRDLLVDWAAMFLDEVGGLPDEPATVVDHHMARHSLWLWDDDGPASMAAATAAGGEVSRISLVYTPLERRRRGYAAACVAALSQRHLDDGATACMLFAQLQNPTSNAIYRRMGYNPVSEVLSFRFG